MASMKGRSHLRLGSLRRSGKVNLREAEDDLAETDVIQLWAVRKHNANSQCAALIRFDCVQ